MYAFKLDLSTSSTTIPSNCTSSPYAPIQKRPPPQSNTNFFWGDQSHHQDHRHRSKRPRYEHKPPPGPESCFFCLSNPSIQKHLITSIGSDAYLTTAKGPLTNLLV